MTLFGGDGKKRNGDDGKAKRDSSRYEDIKARSGDRARRVSAAGRDIGKPPAVADHARRDGTRSDFQAFCEAYAPESFPLQWSPDHITAISKIEGAVLRGELFAFRGLDEEDLENYYLVAEYVSCLRRFGRLESVTRGPCP